MTSTTTTTEMYYALREKQAPHRYARLYASYNGDDAECCNSHTVTFTFDEDAPLFRVDDPAIAAKALVVDTAWYNSDAERPGWGSMNVAGLEIVRVTAVMQTTVTAMNYQLPMLFTDVIGSFDEPRTACSKFLGKELPNDKSLGHWGIRIIRAPLAESLLSLQEKCTERKVLFGSGTPSEYFCWGVCALPEKYAPITKGAPALAVITSYNAPASVSTT